MSPRLRCAFVICLVLIARVPLQSAQDMIKAYPELERLLANGKPSAQDREALNGMLSSMSPADRDKFVQGMIEVGQRIEREGITVDAVFMKLRKGSENEKLLTVTNRLSDKDPLTPEELAQLSAIPLTGTLEVSRVGAGGVAGAKKQVRLRVIMHKPIQAPIQFALPPEGTLVVVQLDEGWLTFPRDYTASSKTMAIKPGRENATDMDYDIGNGRTGGEAYYWGR